MHPKVMRGLMVVYLSVAVDMLGSSLIMPITPFLTIDIGGTKTQVGAVLAAYAGAQLISTLWMGKFSDKFGRKITFILSMAGSAIGLLGTALCQNTGQLIASRAVAGFFAGSSGAANAYISDVSSKEERPKYLALVGAAAAISFVVGPPIGSGLAQFTLRVPAYVASGAAGCGLLLVIFFIQNPGRLLASIYKKNDDDQLSKSVAVVADGKVTVMTEEEARAQRELDAVKVEKDAAELASSQTQAKTPEEAPTKVRWHIILLIGALAFFNMCTFSSFASTLAIWLQELRGYTSLETGFMFTGAAIIGVIDQVVLFNLIRVRLGLPLTMALGSLTAAIGLFVVPWWNNLVPIISGFVLMILGSMLVTSSVPALLSNEATGKNTGTILSVGQFASAGARIVAPIMYTQLVQQNLKYPWLVASGISTIALILAIVLYFITREKRDVEAPLKPTEEDPECEALQEIADTFFKLLRDRNYRLTHPKARVAIIQKLEESFPFIHEDGEERQNDVQTFLAHLADGGTAVKNFTA